MLDAIIDRLQRIHSFNIHAVQEDGSVAPWWEVTGASVVPELIVTEADIMEQVQTISARIMHWGRMVAQCKRVCDIEERGYRAWRSQFFLNLLVEVGDGKKPTDKIMEAQMRVTPEYAEWYERTERAEEAYNTANAVLDGFRAKKEMLRLAVYRRNEDGAAILSI